MTDSLHQLEVALGPDEPDRILSIAGDTQAALEWILHTFAPAAGYVGALAVRGQELRCVFWQWPEQ
jgi:hypothetical protein